jgi:hypothetical protein
MEKYFYLFGGVIIGSVFTYYFFEKRENYEHHDEDDDDDDGIHSHIVNSQIMQVQCEPQLIKLKPL